jgi:integrase
MAFKERLKTKYPGVWYADKNGLRVFYINYRKRGNRNKTEELVRTSAENWSAAKASAERTKRINGQAMTNAERRKSKQSEKENPTINDLWALYLESRGNEVKSINNDKNRYQLHIEKSFWNKKPQELAPLDVDRLKQQVKKNHSVGTTRNVLELLRRIINFGVQQRLCQPLTWTIKLSKVDPDSTRIEPLTEQQFQKLHEIWDSYHDPHIVNIHRFIAWTGSRPSEPLKLLWKDIDFAKGVYTKRKTKSGQSPTLPMGNMTRRILEAQRRLLDTCPEIMRNSPLVLPGPPRW